MLKIGMIGALVINLIGLVVPPPKVELNRIDELVLTWKCSASGQNYEELFAKKGDKILLKWRPLAPEGEFNPERDLYVALCIGSHARLYPSCCKREIPTSKLGLESIVSEMAYSIAWWGDFERGRITIDDLHSTIIYSWPYKKIRFDASTKLPLEIRYLGRIIRYSNYQSIPGMGSIPGRIEVIDNGKTVLEKRLQVSHTASDAFFNSDNLPFSEDRYEPVEEGALTE